MNGYVEAGYVVILGTLGTYSVSLIARERAARRRVGGALTGADASSSGPAPAGSSVSAADPAPQPDGTSPRGVAAAPQPHEVPAEPRTGTSP